MFADRPDNWVVLEIMASVDDTNPATKYWQAGAVDTYTAITGNSTAVLSKFVSWPILGSLLAIVVASMCVIKSSTSSE